VEERLARQARNEALLRQVNEQIATLRESAGGWADSDQGFDFQCECGKLDSCDARVVLTAEEYERVHGQRDRFVVVPGHETDELEVVVEANERYAIVDKREAYERFVE
jgi:hypothetical protein